jgi:hypothetical protein
VEAAVIVKSFQLEVWANQLRRRKRGMFIHEEGVYVTPAQLGAAAKLLREAAPSVCNGDVQERPGFIERQAQGDPSVLVFQIGILPSTTYRIHRRGRVEAGS